MDQGSLDIKTVQVSTKVIIHAGNARGLVNEVIEAADRGDFDYAVSTLDKASEEIKAAHNTQTEVIQAEARGDSLEFSLLLTHAQDTLIAAMSEVTMARHILKLYRRIEKLEARQSEK